jgi:hypothetical protein
VKKSVLAKGATLATAIATLHWGDDAESVLMNRCNIADGSSGEAQIATLDLTGKEARRGQIPTKLDQVGIAALSESLQRLIVREGSTLKIYPHKSIELNKKAVAA